MNNSDNVIILILASGEHLISSTKTTNDGLAYLCSNVLQILSQGDPVSGQLQMGMVPYLPFSNPKDVIAIPTSITGIAAPSDELLAHYSERFSLIYAPASKIIL